MADPREVKLGEATLSDVMDELCRRYDSVIIGFATVTRQHERGVDIVYKSLYGGNQERMVALASVALQDSTAKLRGAGSPPYET